MTATCSKRARTPGRTLAVTHSEEASNSNDPEWYPEASRIAARRKTAAGPLDHTGKLRCARLRRRAPPPRHTPCKAVPPG